MASKTIRNHSYPLSFKKQVMNFYKPSENGRGLEACSAKFKVPKPTLQYWVKTRDSILEESNPLVNGTARRLPGGGRKPSDELDSKVMKFVKKRNDMGLRVKDRYIIIKAKRAFEKLKNNGSRLRSLKFSKGWLEKFKKRNKLVSRRVTSTRMIPSDAKEVCFKFFRRFFRLVKQFDINLRNIINFDQVARYFSSSNYKTLAPKGTKNVRIQKAGSSHKKFTATFSSTASGEFLKPHFLFGGLKNKPKVAEGCVVEVNKTSMFSAQIFGKFLNDIILSRENHDKSEHTLILLDSFPGHTKFINECSKYYPKYHFLLIPPNLTNILQPNDVSLNKSYHDFYSGEYDQYLAESILHKKNVTKAGEFYL